MGWNKSRIRGFDEGWNISLAGNPTPVWIGATSSGLSGSGTAVFTYATVPIGSAVGANRRVFVTGSLGSDGLTIVGVTIGGVAADLAQSGVGVSSNGGSLTWVASAVVPTGTTTPVVVTYSGGNFTASLLGVWTVNNDFLQSPIPTGAAHHPTAANAATINLATAKDGFSLFTGFSFGAGGTWSVSSTDDPIIQDGIDTGNGRWWGHSNGTQARTAQTVMAFSATTNLHFTGWNFR